MRGRKQETTRSLPGVDDPRKRRSMPSFMSFLLCFTDRVVMQATRGGLEIVEGYLKEHLQYAIQHRDIISRFGRFPHRNNILGRTATPEEEAFLREPGSSF